MSTISISKVRIEWSIEMEDKGEEPEGIRKERGSDLKKNQVLESVLEVVKENIRERRISLPEIAFDKFLRENMEWSED